MPTSRRDNARTFFPWLFLGLGFAQAAHSMEEVATGLWKWMPIVSGAVRAKFGFFPILGWSEQGFTLANMVLIALILGFSPLPFLNHTWAWKIVTVTAVIETVNGLNHVGAAIARGSYFSGCISGVALIVLSLLIWIPRLALKGKRP